ncbi:MAG: hypothetical protein BYD32DRAFT_455412 [Podila humilis]|nr:MAG: hypothetical protein BYD32DRAFT_455412 [Podila humilis]
MSSDTPASTSTPDAADTHGSNASKNISNASDHISTKTATPSKATTAASTSNYTRHNAPQRSKFKPRWHTQPYMMFLALRSMPNYTAARQQIISAAVELDRKFSAERGLPRVFTGKTPMNSASACLTNNGDKYFIPFKPEGSRSTHFRLAYQPGDFETAVNEYDSWMEKLIKHDWPLCFGVPKEGAIPIHVLEQQEQARKRALETEAGETETPTTEGSSTEGNNAGNMVTPNSETEYDSKDTTESPGQRKRSPESDYILDETSRSSKKQKAEETPDQESKVAEKLEHLDLQATTPKSSTSVPSTPEPSSSSQTAKSTSSEREKVDEYRLEDLDLSNVPTSLTDIVKVDLSTIPNSGNGLFAKIDLPASTPLGFYFGVPMTENEFDSLKDGVGVASHYSIMYRRTVLDATDENGMPYSDPKGRLYCPFHFMNEDPSGNITFITGSVVNQVICTTNRDIKAGEELFVFYGKEVDRFWEQIQEGREGVENKKGGNGRSRTESPVRKLDELDPNARPRRNNVYKPARYTR